MKILVCITHVPDTTSKISFSEDGTEFNKNGVQYIIGPYDDYALAKAIELKEKQGGTVTVLNVGKAETEPTLRKALAIGADNAIRVDEDPKDSLFVAHQIAEVAKAESYDLILMGRESIDFNGGQVHAMVGEMLNIPSLSPVMLLDIEGASGKATREIEGGTENLEIILPLVVGCQEPIAEWRIPNMRGIMSARSKPMQVKEPYNIELKTKLEKYELPPEKGEVKIIAPDEIDQLVDLLKNEAKVI